jgi:hypothetical protein
MRGPRRRKVTSRRLLNLLVEDATEAGGEIYLRGTGVQSSPSRRKRRIG